MTAAMVLLALGLALVPSPGCTSRRRLSAVLPGASVQVRRARPTWPHTHLPLIGALAAGVAVAVTFGGGAGAVAGVGGALVAGQLLRRLEPAATRRARALRVADLPACLDLLVAALSAGLPVPSALSAVAAATTGPLAGELGRVARLAELGAGPAAAWADHSDDPVLGPVARAAQRSADSGTALAGSLARLAADCRAEGAARAETAAHRAGVIAMAPLGLCFLPAFICLGVVPVVIGIATQVLP